MSLYFNVEGFTYIPILHLSYIFQLLEPYLNFNVRVGGFERLLFRDCVAWMNSELNMCFKFLCRRNHIRGKHIFPYALEGRA